MLKRTLETTFLLFVFSFGMALADDSDRRAATARDDYERVIKEIEIKKKKQLDLQKEEKSLLGELDRLAFLKDKGRKELRALKKDHSETAKSISAHEKEIKRLTEQMAITEKQIESRVTALYKISKAGPWVFLLSGENYGDFLRMSTFLYSMIDHDIRLFTTYENQREQEKALKRELAQIQSRLEEKQANVDRKKREIEALERKRKGALDKTRKEEKSFSKVIEDLEEQAERLESMIKSLSEGREETVRSGPGFAALRGKLPLPVKGKIETKRQGRLRGVSLKAPVGTIVRAVYRGRVVYADWFKGYGNLLIIDHGDNFYTVMGHASELLKERKDWVETGEPVAKVGTTGSLGDSSLYFEIRQKGIPLDPLEWLSREGRLALK